ncbi:hypothetical protein ES707_16698 [subsurface metagenome]
MSDAQNLLVTVCLAGWFGIILVQLARNIRGFWILFSAQSIIILATAYCLNRYFGYYSRLEVKGALTIGEGWILCGLYVCTLLGILGNNTLAQTKVRRGYDIQVKLRWVSFIKPLIISPIVFLTVLSVLNNIGTPGNTPTTVVMQFMLAFQNGFFWKSIVDRVERPISEVNK